MGSKIRILFVAIIAVWAFLGAAVLLQCGEEDVVVPSDDDDGGNKKDDGGGLLDDDDSDECFCNGSCISCTDIMECSPGEECINGICDFPECYADDDDSEGNVCKGYRPDSDKGGCSTAKGIDCECFDDSECCSPPLRCSGTVCVFDCTPGTYLCTCDTKNPCKDEQFDCIDGICDYPKGCAAKEGECPAGYICDYDTDTCIPSGGKIQATPSVFSFGQVTYGSTHKASVQLVNVGTLDVKILQIGFDRATNTKLFQFVEKPKASTVIKAGEGVKIEVQYQPDDCAIDEGTVVVTNDSGNAPSLEIPMVMEFKGVPDLCLVDYATNQDLSDINGGNYKNLVIDFADLPLGGTRSLPVYVKNCGSGTACLKLSKYEMALSGTPFEIELKEATPGEEAVSLPKYINPGEKIIADMTLVCPSSGTGKIISEKLEVETDDVSAAYKEGDPQATPDKGSLVVNLAGRCGYVPPAIQVSKTQVDLGEVQLIKNPSIECGKQQLIIKNVGGADLVIDNGKSGLTIPGTPFVVTGMTSTVPPNGEISVTIEYCPTTVNDPGNNLLKIFTNDETNPEVDINITAKPVDPELVIEDQDDKYGATRGDKKIEFGNIDLNDTATVDVYIKNGGVAGMLYINGLKIVGAGVFEIEPATMPSIPLALKTGEQHLLKVNFKPTDTNAYTAQMEITTNDKDIKDGSLVMDITGTGARNVGNDTMVIVLTNAHDKGGDCTFGGGTDKRDVDLKVQMPNGNCPNFGEPRCDYQDTQGEDRATISMQSFSTQGDGAYHITAYYEQDCVETGLFCNCDSKSVSGSVSITVSPNANDPSGQGWVVNVPYSIGGAGQTVQIKSITRVNGRFIQP
ncbi:MAG: hypothetical protein Kow0090_18290 [Myxococcota bacterium]